MPTSRKNCCYSILMILSISVKYNFPSTSPHWCNCLKLSNWICICFGIIHVHHYSHIQYCMPYMVIKLLLMQLVTWPDEVSTNWISSFKNITEKHFRAFYLFNIFPVIGTGKLYFFMMIWISRFLGHRFQNLQIFSSWRFAGLLGVRLEAALPSPCHPHTLS